MYDVLIIGGGPAGLSAAVYAKRAGLDAVVIEKDYAGGQIAVSEQVDNYLGLPKTSGYDLSVKFTEHAKMLGADFYEGEVLKISKKDNTFVLDFKDESQLLGKTVIYTAGTSYRRLEVNGSKLNGVSYCAVCDGMFYKDKTVAVVGGGDTALGDALYLSRIAKKVYVIHRRDEFRANKSLQHNVNSADNIEILYNSQVTEIFGETRVESIAVSDKKIDVDGVFVAIGSVPNSQLLQGICDLDENGYVIAGEDGITSTAGIFVAGDVRTKSLRQVITAASDGAFAVMSAENYIENQ